METAMTDRSKGGRSTKPSRSGEPDYRVFANIEDDVRRLEGIACDLFLPSARGEAAYAILYPSVEQMEQLYPMEGGIGVGSFIFEIRLTAEVSGASGQNLTVTVPIAYAGPARTVLRGRDEKEHAIEVKILELVVTTCQQPESVEIPSHVEGFFRIVGSAGLIPPLVASKGWREYKIEPFAQISATLASGTEITFDRMLAYREEEKGLRLTEDLTAHFAFEGDLATLDRVETARKELDDYLLVSSFGGRDFGRCVGWRADDPDRSIEGFVAILPWVDGTSSDRLIRDRTSFGAFCQETYNSFSTAPKRDLLRQALLYVAPKDAYVSNYSFVRLYSALETLVLYHRRNADLEFILSKREFSKLRKFLSEKIGEYEMVDQCEERMELVKGKLSELNRTSFSEAFNDLCSNYAVDVSDLWPVHGPSTEWPLSQLRNMIVHGDVVRGVEERAVVTAEWHLRWTVERILLAILNWPLEGTGASAEHLSECGSLLYREWEVDRRALQEANQ